MPRQSALRSEAANARVKTAKGLTWRLTCRYHVTDPEHHVAVSLDRAVMLVPKHRAANTLIQETSARVHYKNRLSPRRDLKCFETHSGGCV